MKMIETIKTLNSTYEVDWEQSLVRRTGSDHAPTLNQTRTAEDGEWQNVEHVEVINDCLCIHWGLFDGRLRNTITSVIVSRTIEKE